MARALVGLLDSSAGRPPSVLGWRCTRSSPGSRSFSAASPAARQALPSAPRSPATQASSRALPSGGTSVSLPAVAAGLPVDGASKVTAPTV